MGRPEKRSGQDPKPHSARPTRRTAPLSYRAAGRPSVVELLRDQIGRQVCERPPTQVRYWEDPLRNLGRTYRAAFAAVHIRCRY